MLASGSGISGNIYKFFSISHLVTPLFGDNMYNGQWDIGAFRRDSCYRRSRDGKLDMARTRAQVVSRCLGVPGRYPEGL